jgi:twitching motility protein PilT
MMQEGQASGMQTLDQHLEQLLAAGTIAAEDALEVAQDREAFARTIKRLQPGFELPEDLRV